MEMDVSSRIVSWSRHYGTMFSKTRWKMNGLGTKEDGTEKKRRLGLRVDICPPEARRVLVLLMLGSWTNVVSVEGVMPFAA